MMSMVLPPLPTDIRQFRKLRADPSLWLPMARDIARSHGYAGLELSVFATGTNLVVGIGDGLILKIFPPMLRGQFVSERASLTLLRGRLGLPIPEIVFEGERDGWPYLVITRLSGVVASEVWPTLGEDQKEIVLGQIGATIAEVQRVPVGELALIEPRWDQFIATQIEGCRARHTRLGLPAKFLHGLDDLLREVPKLIPLHAPPVILVGEYSPENFLVSRDGAT